MGFVSISPASLILIIVIILLLFGAKRLKNIGTDLADAIKNFRRGMSEKNIEKKKKLDKKTIKDEEHGD